MTTADHAFPMDPSDPLSNLLLQKLRHDLMNAVRPIVEIPKWIDEDIAEDGTTLSTTLRDHLDLLGTHSVRLARMIEDLLVYAHINLNQQTDNLTLGDRIGRMVKGTLPPNFQLTTDLPCDALPVPDADVETMLDALISNAIKHHDRDRGKIRITCKKTTASTQLTVADDGPGIEPQFLERIFDPLTTLHSRDQIEGSGMGLTIVRRIASVNGGHVKAISPPHHRGTGILVWFP